MKILYSPQVSDKVITYDIEDEIITVTLDEKTEVYDFSELTDGVAEQIESDVFDFNPIISAKREDGKLWVEVLNFITNNASEEERFPEWSDTDG